MQFINFRPEPSTFTHKIPIPRDGLPYTVIIVDIAVNQEYISLESNQHGIVICQARQHRKSRIIFGGFVKHIFGVVEGGIVILCWSVLRRKDRECQIIICLIVQSLQLLCSTEFKVSSRIDRRDHHNLTVTDCERNASEC